MSEEEYNGYKIVTVNHFLLKEVKAIGKGSVPMELRGLFTSTAQAKLGIDAYLTVKESNNGKAKSTS